MVLISNQFFVGRVPYTQKTRTHSESMFAVVDYFIHRQHYFSFSRGESIENTSSGSCKDWYTSVALICSHLHISVCSCSCRRVTRKNPSYSNLFLASESDSIPLLRSTIPQNSFGRYYHCRSSIVFLKFSSTSF